MAPKCYILEDIELIWSKGKSFLNSLSYLLSFTSLCSKMFNTEVNSLEILKYTHLKKCMRQNA